MNNAEASKRAKATVVNSSERKAPLAIGIGQSLPQSPQAKQPPTPASLRLKRAGADAPSKKDEDFKAAEFQLTVEDLEQTNVDVQKAALNFDVQTYIQQMVDERTKPILTKATGFLSTVADVSR